MIKQLSLRLAQLCGLFSLARYLTRGQLRILCYHGIWTGPPPHFGDCLFMSAEKFRRRMDLLSRRGYEVIPLARACDDLRAGHVDARGVVITIDDAWAGTGLHMLPVLKSRGYPATLYVTTDGVLTQQPVLHKLLACLLERASRRPDPAQLLGEPALGPMSDAQLTAKLHRRLTSIPDTSERMGYLRLLGTRLGVDVDPLLASRAFMLMDAGELNAADRDGVDIQLHTHTHRMPDFDLDRIRQEIARNHEALASLLGDTGRRFVHFCYPGGAYHPSMFPLLRQMGIESATTTDFGLNPPKSNMLQLNRILDCESFSDLEFEARLCGFWSLLVAVRNVLHRLLRVGRNATPLAAG